jgi:RHS repeat-associated protein
VVAIPGGAQTQYPTTQTYDALGNMAELSYTTLGVTLQKLYDENGRVLGQAANAQGSNPDAFIPLPGGATANYSGGSLKQYWHADWLGSVRLSSTPSRTMYEDLAYAPFGESYARTGQSWVPFAGLVDQLENDDFHTLFRDLNTHQGRWLTPDPAGLAAVDPSNPQTWNRYAYVNNNPLSFVDPSGLLMDPVCAVNGDGCGGGGSSDITDPNYSPSSSLLDSPVAVFLGDPFGFPGWDNISEVFGQTSVWNGERWISLGSSGPNDSGINLNRDDGTGGGAAGSCSQGGSGTFGGLGGSAMFGGAHAFAQTNGAGSSKKGTNSCSQPAVPKPQQPCYSSNSFTDKSVRFFSLLRLPETWEEWVAGYGAKLSFLKVAQAGARSAGGADSLGAGAIGTGGMVLGSAGSAVIIGATMADFNCQIGPVDPYTEK